MTSCSRASSRRRLLAAGDLTLGVAINLENAADVDTVRASAFTFVNDAGASGFNAQMVAADNTITTQVVQQPAFVAPSLAWVAAPTLQNLVGGTTPANIIFAVGVTTAIPAGGYITLTSNSDIWASVSDTATTCEKYSDSACTTLVTNAVDSALSMTRTASKSLLQIHAGATTLAKDTREVQTITITGATGTWDVSFTAGGSTRTSGTAGALTVPATAAAVTTVLEGLSNIGAGGVIVTKTTTATNVDEYRITFSGNTGTMSGDVNSLVVTAVTAPQWWLRSRWALRRT